jgi:hypothetical protein
VEEELAFIGAQFEGYLTAITAANAQQGASVKVGAVVIDSEFFVWKGYPQADPSTQYWRDLAHKDQLIVNVTRVALPTLALDRISFYSRGSVHFRPDLNDSNCLRGRPAVEALSLPAGHCMGTDVSLDLGAADKASPFSPILYTMPEPELMRRHVENTAAAATAYGVKGGNTVPYLGLGFGNRRYNHQIDAK